MDNLIAGAVGIAMGAIGVFVWLNMPVYAGKIIRVAGREPHEFYYSAAFRSSISAQQYVSYLSEIGLTAVYRSRNTPDGEIWDISWAMVFQPKPTEIRRLQSSFEVEAQRLGGTLIIASTSFTNYSFVLKNVS